MGSAREESYRPPASPTPRPPPERTLSVRDLRWSSSGSALPLCDQHRSRAESPQQSSAELATSQTCCVNLAAAPALPVPRRPLWSPTCPWQLGSSYGHL